MVDNLKYINKNWIVFSIIVITIMELLLSIQSMGFVDEGWVLSSYQTFFSEPECNSTYSLFFLNGLIGGLFQQITGGGLFVFRVFNVFVIDLTFCFVAFTLKDFFQHKWLITLGFIVTLSTWAYFGNISLHHNYVTSFFSVIVAFLLFKAYLRHSSALLFAASFLVALCVFVRLPNIVLIILVLEYLIIDKIINGAKVISLLFVSIGGFVVGVVFVVLLMLLCGHLHLFIDVIENDLLVSANSSQSTHNVWNLFRVFLNNYKTVMLVSITVILILIGSSYFSKLKYFCVVCFLLLFGIFCGLKKKAVIDIEFLYGLSIAFVIISLFTTKDKNYKILSVFSLTMAVFLPIGSDMGLKSMGTFSSVLLVPLSLFVFENEIVTGLRRSTCAILMTVVFLSNIIYSVCCGSFDDIAGKYMKREQVQQSSMARGILVTTERAKSVDTVLMELKKYVNKGDYLICYSSIPIFNYLTQTKPYLHTSLFMTFNPESFVRHIKDAENQNPQTPVILWSDFLNHWPQTKERDKLLLEFMERHHYVQVFSYNEYKIFISKEE